jgi:hypothetical protein
MNPGNTRTLLAWEDVSEHPRLAVSLLAWMTSAGQTFQEPSTPVATASHSTSEEKLMQNSHGYTFELDPTVTRAPVRYRNRFGVEIAGDLYIPKNVLAHSPPRP